MSRSQAVLDVLLLVPMSSNEGLWIDAFTRRTVTARIYRPLERARTELSEYLGRPVGFRHQGAGPVFDGQQIRGRAHRTLTAISLADSLERAGLSWRAFDPPDHDYRAWRLALERFRAERPRVVAVSTTYGVDIGWFVPFCALLRRAFPESTIVIGGAAYATSASTYLSLDADVFCVGEGEERLPEIARRVRDRVPLDSIPGLYLRAKGGTLRSTGPAPKLPLESIPVPDWNLSRRIEPPVDPSRELLWYQLETLRGCFFRCQFCTYTTLTQYQPQKAELRAERILSMGRFGEGMLYLTDATASYPVPEWRETLRALVRRGGSPLPIGAFTRLPDLDDETVELMARANVRWCFIGLDSGDSDVLRKMKKGTKLDQVTPAMRALARHGIGAHVSCIFGFPGETAESAVGTRELVSGLNDAHPEELPVFVYNAEPFRFQDLAPLAEKGVASSRPMEWSCDRVLECYVRASRNRNAPVSLITPYAFRVATSDPRFATAPLRQWVHRFLKDVERAVAVFLSSELEGKKLGPAELRELRDLRDRILPHLPAAPRNFEETTIRKAVRRLRAPLERALDSEWWHEREGAVGPLTRSLLAVSYARAFGDLRGAAETFRRGEWPSHAHPIATAPGGVEAVRGQAAELIALERTRNRKGARSEGAVDADA
ncbi:MAG TPA: radical SAM protein [Polyangiaceae bacterium]|nr:radical SAM protein [Polyangiaceae bacterium]